MRMKAWLTSGDCNAAKSRLLVAVMGKILFKSILSTSTSNQPKKYLKY